MSKRLHTQGANQGYKSLRIVDNVFRGFRLSRRVLTIFLLLIAGAVLLWPSSISQRLEGRLLTAKAQGNTARSHTKSRLTARSQKVIEGATITDKRITLKPGYIARRTSAKTIMLRKKKGGGTTIKVTCSCQKANPGGGTGCGIAIENNGTVLVCTPAGCAECDWGKITTTKAR